jgi:hypothetical protein
MEPSVVSVPSSVADIVHLVHIKGVMDVKVAISQQSTRSLLATAFHWEVRTQRVAFHTLAQVRVRITSIQNLKHPLVQEAV